MVSVSDLSVNVNKLAASVGYDLVAPKPSSQVVISGSGRVSISGTNVTDRQTDGQTPDDSIDRTYA